MREEDITIITPVRNTHPTHFKAFFLSCMTNSKSKIVIVDDQSETDYLHEYRRIIAPYLDTGRVHFFSDRKRYFIAGGIYKAATLVQTPFLMRIDSDDMLLKVPYIRPEEEGDYDAYLPLSFPSTLEKILFCNKCNMHAKIFRAPYFRYLYSFHKMHDDIVDQIPEDIFFWLIAFLQNINYKRIVYNVNDCRIHNKIKSSHMNTIIKNNPDRMYRKELIIRVLYDNNILPKLEFKKLMRFLDSNKEKNKGFQWH